MHREQRRIGPVGILLLLPPLVLFVSFFVLPLAYLGLMSLHGYSRLGGVDDTISLANYLRLWLDPFYLRAIVRTFRLAAETAVVALVMGYPIAIFLHRASDRWRGIVIFLIICPLLVSVVVRTLGWLVILAPGGLIDNAARALGLGSASLLHTEAAVVLGLVNVLLPFVVLSVATSLQAIDPAVPLAAASLGARPAKVFLLVYLPLSLPGALAGGLIVFSVAVSSFVLPAILGGASFMVLSTLLYEQAMVLQNWPFASSIAISLLIMALLVVVLQTYLVEEGRYRAVFQ